MEIIESNKICILKPFSPKLDGREASRIFNKINSMGKKNIGIDLSHAQECTIDFFENISLLAENVHISLFNIPSDIFALISFMKFDKIVDLFVSENDFIESSHKLVMRRFSLV